MNDATVSSRPLTRFFELVDAISENPKGLTLAQLSTALDCPKSSLLTILRVLVSGGHLERVEDRYRFGPAIFRMGTKVLSVRSLPLLIRPIMQKLAAASGESVYLAVLDLERDCVRYTEGIESEQTVRYAAAIGASRPLYCGAGALVLLAHQPRAWQEAFVKRTALKPITPKTIVDRRRLLKRLVTVRETGLAVSLGEAASSAAGVAAPVLDMRHEVVGALVIASPIDRFERQQERLEQLVVEAAREASGS